MSREDGYYLFEHLDTVSGTKVSFKIPDGLNDAHTWNELAQEFKYFLDACSFCFTREGEEAWSDLIGFNTLGILDINWDEEEDDDE